MNRPLRPTPLREEVRLRLEEMFPRIAKLPSEDVEQPDRESSGGEQELRDNVADSPPNSRGVNGKHLRLVVVLALVVVALAVWWALSSKAEPLPAPTPITLGGTSTPHATPVASPGSVSTGGSVVVHVAGAVKKPGLVTLPAGSRVGHAISAAGGFAPQAVTGPVNLAAPLADGVQIYVRVAGETDAPMAPLPVAAAGATGGAQGAMSGTTGPLDLNTASADQLDELPGVGPATAQKILAWRTQHGRFSRVDELREVDGIGEKTFARLKELVRV